MRSNHQLKVESACSFSKGIIFFSNMEPEHGVVAKIDNSENIVFEHIKFESLASQQNYVHDKVFTIKSRISRCILLVSWLISIILFMQLKLYLSMQVLFGGFCFSITFMLLTENFAKSSARFHSAEHMAVNALEHLGRPPTLEEIRNFSRFNKRCGTNILTHIQLDSTILFACSFISNEDLRIVVPIILMVIVFILSKLGLLSWGQIFSTLTPTDRELKVAIAGLSEWVKYEENCIENFKNERQKIRIYNY